MTTSVFDAAKIRHAVLSSGLTVNEVSFRVHMPFKTLRQIVDGDSTPANVHVTTLARLAETIGLPLKALFSEPKLPLPSEAEEPAPPPDDDAATIIAILYDRGTTPTVNHDLARGLGWTLERLNTAYDAAEPRLAIAGLRLTRTHGEGSIAPLHDHTANRAAVEHAKAGNTGLSEDTYQAAYQLLTGKPLLPGAFRYRRQVVLGRLGNLGIADAKRHTPTLTPAAEEAFLD